MFFSDQYMFMAYRAWIELEKKNTILFLFQYSEYLENVILRQSSAKIEILKIRWKIQRINAMTRHHIWRQCRAMSRLRWSTEVKVMEIRILFFPFNTICCNFICSESHFLNVFQTWIQCVRNKTNHSEKMCLDKRSTNNHLKRSSFFRKK